MAARKTARKSKRRAAKQPPVVSTLQTENIIPAVAGDACPKKLTYGPHVKSACGDHVPFKACCLSCAVQLPSTDIIEEHVRTGKHVLARVCADHGAEEWR